MNKQIEEMAKVIHDGCTIVKGTYKCDRDCHRCAAITLHEKCYRKSTDVAMEIFADIDNALHAMATEYYQAGHPEYFAVCEMVHHKVMRPIEKEYESEVADDGY